METILHFKSGRKKTLLHPLLTGTMQHLLTWTKEGQYPVSVIGKNESLCKTPQNERSYCQRNAVLLSYVVASLIGNKAKQSQLTPQ